MAETRNVQQQNSKMAAATFGSTTQNKPGMFGTTGSTGFNFGSGTTSGLGTSTLGTATPHATGFSAIKPFGVATTTTATASPFAAPAAAKTTTGFSLGSTPAIAATTGFTLGGLSSAKAPTLTAFGQPSVAGTTLAAKTTAPTGFAFGGQPTTTGLTLGQSTGLTLGGLATSKPATGLIGSTAPKATTSLFSAAAPSATSAPTVGFGLGTAATTGTNLLGVGIKAPAATTAPTAVAGLGGTGTSSTTASGTANGAGNKQSELKNLKDTALPAPLNEIVEHIKKYVKGQKEDRDEISRFSASAMHKVQEDMAAQRQSVAVVMNSIQRDGCAVENLKMDVAQELKNAEIAQRTSDIPPALQHENMAPQEYFQRLIESFEERMQVYRKQIEVMESHLCALSQGHTFTPQDLSQVMHRIHETFIALAAELHGIHESVKLQKQHYLNYRKAYYKDPTDVFASRARQYNRPTAGDLGVGPSPFSSLPNSTAAISNTMTQQGALRSQVSSLGTKSGFGTGFGTTGPQVSAFGTTTGLGTSFGSGLGTSSTFGTTGGLGTSTGFGGTSSFGAQSLGASTGFGTPAGTTLGTSFGSTPSAFGTQQKFELKKPPVGNKRGKKR